MKYAILCGEVESGLKRILRRVARPQDLTDQFVESARLASVIAIFFAFAGERGDGFGIVEEIFRQLAERFPGQILFLQNRRRAAVDKRHGIVILVVLRHIRRRDQNGRFALHLEVRTA